MKKTVLIAIAVLTCLMLTACGTQDIITGYSSGDVKLGQYKEVTYTPEDVSVTDEEISNKVSTDLLNTHMQNVDVEGKTVVEDGDTIICDYKGFMDGEQFDGGTSENAEIVVGEEGMIPGFVEGFVGAEIGVEKDVDVVFPDPYDMNPDYAGKPATFKILVHRIVTKEIPQYTDDIVAQYTEYSTVAEYDNYVRETLTQQKQTSADTKKKYDLFLKIIRSSEFDDQALAPYVIENRARLVSQHDQQYSQFLGINAATYYTQYLGMTEEETNDYFDSLAKMQTEYTFVLAAIADKENIEVTEEEIDKLSDDMTTSYGYSTREELYSSLATTYNKPAREVVASQARLNKAADIVMSTALAN